MSARYLSVDHAIMRDPPLLRWTVSLKDLIGIDTHYTGLMRKSEQKIICLCSKMSVGEKKKGKDSYIRIYAGSFNSSNSASSLAFRIRSTYSCSSLSFSLSMPITI
jgi:hypothetical protein